MTVITAMVIIGSILGRMPTGEQGAIARALVNACHEERNCVLDGLIYAEHESGFQIAPRPYSWDAILGLARGPWQLHNAPVQIEKQAIKWVALRQASLDICGTLALLASGRCDRGLSLVEARQNEAQTWAAILDHPWVM